MARKGRKTRWRKLPIPIGTGQGEESCARSHHVTKTLEPVLPSSLPPKEQVSRVTFNEDEYTKITTPRQDVLFKKGYFTKKKCPPPDSQQTSYTSPEPSQSPSESYGSEQYIGCDEGVPYPAPFAYPTGYMDPNNLFYLNGGSYEIYDPYTNSVTVIVGPGQGYPGQPVLAAVPCHPVPLQTVEWFQPPPQHHRPSYKKRNSTDSHNWGSSQSCESPSSGQEVESHDSSVFYPQPQYIYPGYMFGAPLYNINGVNVQGAGAPPPQHPPPPADQPKRRKKLRKRRRPGMGGEWSESSCEEVAGSGVSSDAGQGSSCSKTTDSGIHTGADSPQPVPSTSPVSVHVISHTSPPDVSTEEEPSQPITGEVPYPDLNSHHTTTPTTTDSSTEDETNRQSVEDSKDSVIEEVIVKTENIALTQSTNDRLQEDYVDKEKNDEEERLRVQENEKSELTTQHDELSEEEEEEKKVEEVKLNSEQSLETPKNEESSEAAKIKREESEEWVNAKECNGSENEDEPVCVIEKTEQVEYHPIYTDDILLPDNKEDIEECIAEETGYSEEGWGSAEETSVEERWAMAELGEDVTVDKPITEAVTRWLESQGTKVLVLPQRVESEDEGIGEETTSPTGPKNVRGNPFLVRYPSTRTRVADMMSCENQEWMSKCDPMTSVDKYYHLGAELPPSAPITFKTATAPPLLHIDPSVPFPCGLVCCILQ